MWISIEFFIKNSFFKKKYLFLKIYNTNNKEFYKVEIRGPHNLTPFSSLHRWYSFYFVRQYRIKRMQHTCFLKQDHLCAWLTNLLFVLVFNHISPSYYVNIYRSASFCLMATGNSIICTTIIYLTAPLLIKWIFSVFHSSKHPYTWIFEQLSNYFLKMYS